MPVHYKLLCRILPADGYFQHVRPGGQAGYIQQFPIGAGQHTQFLFQHQLPAKGNALDVRLPGLGGQEV